jgi:hypothetical protein
VLCGNLASNSHTRRTGRANLAGISACIQLIIKMLLIDPVHVTCMLAVHQRAVFCAIADKLRFQLGDPRLSGCPRCPIANRYRTPRSAGGEGLRLARRSESTRPAGLLPRSLASPHPTEAMTAATRTTAATTGTSRSLTATLTASRRRPRRVRER